MIVVGSILTIIGGFFTRLVSEGVLKYLAIKALLISLITITLPIVLVNVFNKIFSAIMEAVASNVDTTGISSISYEFTGFAGYLAYHLQLPQGVSILLTALAIRFVLNFIPFVG